MTEHPERIAFRAGTMEVTYGMADLLSKNLAGHLALEGIRPGDRIAILLERDFTLPIALLAAWKLGAAYVPLDPANPPERLKLVIEDQDPVHILVSASLRDRLPEDVPVILLENRMLEDIKEPASHVVSPNDPAYIIYTSGSTGKPKGVVVSHGALGNFLLSMAEVPGFSEADRLLAVTTISFDISALEIFLPLVKGGSFELIPTETARDGRALLEKINSSGASVMQATPATWRLLLDAGWEDSPDLKILCGGESLDLQLACELTKRGCQVWNLYGPTETTIWSALWRVPKNPTCIRIGRPIANTGLQVLAADGTPVPPGVIGELWISGNGLSDGYWKRPDLNAKAFVDSRYHTGDLARWCPDGELECLGRSDGQVKIRGFRVELGEIEAALATHPMVNQAKVALRGALSSDKKLVAWITLLPDSKPPVISELREFLSKLLPAYMLPSDIAVIDRFPLNASGKVDVAALPDPETTNDSPPPSTPTEMKLAEIWSDLLQRSPIQRSDDWFQVGGHSLLALRLFSRIHETFGLSLPLSAILEAPSLHSLASRIDMNLQSSYQENS